MPRTNRPGKGRRKPAMGFKSGAQSGRGPRRLPGSAAKSRKPPQPTNRPKARPNSHRNQAKRTDTSGRTQTAVVANLAAPPPRQISGFGDTIKVQWSKLLLEIRTDNNGDSSPVVPVPNSATGTNCLFICPQLYAGHPSLLPLYEEVGFRGPIVFSFEPASSLATDGSCSMYIDPRYLATQPDVPTDIMTTSARTGVALFMPSQRGHLAYHGGPLEKSYAPTAQTSQFSFRSDQQSVATMNQVILYVLVRGCSKAGSLIGHIRVSCTMLYSSRKVWVSYLAGGSAVPFSRLPLLMYTHLLLVLWCHGPLFILRCGGLSPWHLGLLVASEWHLELQRST